MSNKSKLVSSTHEIFSGWKLLESIHTSLNDYPIFNKNAQTNNSRKQKSRKTKDRILSSNNDQSSAIDVSKTNSVVSKKRNLLKKRTAINPQQKKKTSKSATPSNKSAKAKKKKDDEERKKKEEEEAQQRAELAEKERLENEKRLAEEKSSVAKEINELRRRELSEFYEFMQPRQQEANEIRERQRGEFKWKRVMRCDGTPDPTVLPEINTFISLWYDEQQRIDVDYTMKQTNLVLSLIKELNNVINSIPNGSSELERIPIYKKTIYQLEDTLDLKWLQTAHNIMLKATDLQDLETNNFQYTAENENVTICIWGNLSHNARIKGFQFDKYNFGFDLPKPLSLANIAIVGFFLKYDYYSERSLLSKCRVRTNEYTYDPIPEPLIDESAKKPVENPDDLLDASLPPELRKLMEQTRQREREEAAAAAAAAEAQNNKENSIIDRSSTQGPSDENQVGKDLTQSSIDRKKDDKLFDATADEILEQLADESVVDLRCHWPMIPLLQINLYNIPPQPKKVQEWTIMQVDNDNVLVSYPYPSDPMIAEQFYEEYSSNNKNKPTETDPGKVKTEEKPEEPIDLSMTLEGTMIENSPEMRKMYLAMAAKQESALVFKYKIPNDVFITEKPLLARWIKGRNYWKQDGYVDYQYSPDTRMISFKTYNFGTYALLNDRHAHMPFQSWRMRPKALNHLLFTLNTQSFEITFEIRYDTVAVVLPPRRPEPSVEEKPASIFATKGIKPSVPPLTSTSSLSTSRTAVDDSNDIYKTHPIFAATIEPIANKFMTLKELIEKLKSLGLNVFPESDSDSYVSTLRKNHKLEWWTYNQMAIVSSCTAFSYSHWNAFINDEMKIVVGCKEQLVDQSTQDDDLQCIILTSELVGFTDISESSQEFVEASTFTDYHAELFHLVREKFSSEAFARIMDASPIFIETVNQLLLSIKPLTYA